jgi:hypothetical protein
MSALMSGDDDVTTFTTQLIDRFRDDVVTRLARFAR